MPAELSASIMIVAFLLGSIMVVVGGLGFMRSSPVLMTPHSQDRKSTRLNSSHVSESRMPSSA